MEGPLEVSCGRMGCETGRQRGGPHWAGFLVWTPWDDSNETILPMEQNESISSQEFEARDTDFVVGGCHVVGLVWPHYRAWAR